MHDTQETPGLSLGEIKSRAVNDEYLYVCDYVDDDGFKLINKIKSEMKGYGIFARQFEDGVKKSPELFENLEQLYDEINGITSSAGRPAIDALVFTGIKRLGKVLYVFIRYTKAPGFPTLCLCSLSKNLHRATAPAAATRRP